MVNGLADKAWWFVFGRTDDMDIADDFRLPVKSTGMFVRALTEGN